MDFALSKTRESSFRVAIRETALSHSQEVFARIKEEFASLVVSVSTRFFDTFYHRSIERGFSAAECAISIGLHSQFGEDFQKMAEHLSLYGIAPSAKSFSESIKSLQTEGPVNLDFPISKQVDVEQDRYDLAEKTFYVFYLGGEVKALNWLSKAKKRRQHNLMLKNTAEWLLKNTAEGKRFAARPEIFIGSKTATYLDAFECLPLLASGIKKEKIEEHAFIDENDDFHADMAMFESSAWLSSEELPIAYRNFVILREKMGELGKPLTDSYFYERVKDKSIMPLTSQNFINQITKKAK